MEGVRVHTIHNEELWCPQIGGVVVKIFFLGGGGRHPQKITKSVRNPPRKDKIFNTFILGCFYIWIVTIFGVPDASMKVFGSFFFPTPPGRIDLIFHTTLLGTNISYLRKRKLHLPSYLEHLKGV